ncbi:3-dehydroquinate synthase [Macrococcoides caseolyticum]|uniref:3-dehydroquinate synthase n=1 Tax=Macrococcoides caseolyticum TaxID=69966 RepID=UPI001F445AF3|nr:3-dehydroquinate synthase [Macrococcus caseolyticus]MCE4957068.1 3-dehydroquinate synthase [Macrococcus caseolyticus]
MKLTTNYQTNQPVNNYDIIITENALALEYDFDKFHQCFALIDERVYALHQSKINAFLNRYAAERILLPSGETVKTIGHFEMIVEQLLEKNIKRNDCLIAIGGGATGDFTGYIAASILRGIAFIQVPTTILAHDAAIGGKTGINARQGKNLIGAFKRPEQVIYDIDFLDTLSETEQLSGFAEIVKHVILNGEYVTNIAQKIDNLDLKRLMHDFTKIEEFKDKEKLKKWITYGIQTKLDVVQRDEHESGVRKFLNFGHTIGHALEFTHKLPHGIAVMHGMMYALILSGYDDEIVVSFYKWLKQLGYPVVDIVVFDDYYPLLRKDKKNENEAIYFVVMQQKVGRLEDVFQIQSFDYEILNRSFHRWGNILRSCYNEK